MEANPQEPSTGSYILAQRTEPPILAISRAKRAKTKITCILGVRTCIEIHVASTGIFQPKCGSMGIVCHKNVPVFLFMNCLLKKRSLFPSTKNHTILSFSSVNFGNFQDLMSFSTKFCNRAPLHPKIPPILKP